MQYMTLAGILIRAAQAAKDKLRLSGESEYGMGVI